jgi:GTP cyclohydrolase II
MNKIKNKDKKPLYLLFGPPGAGKSTQALLLQEKLGFYYVSWGKISREIMSNSGPYKNCYQIVKKLTEEEKPFPEGFIANILSQEIGNILIENKNIKGIILDGFPRRIKEAQELVEIIKTHNLSLYAIVKFNISYGTIKERINKRIFCPKCGKFYNNIIKPKKKGICDSDGVKLIKRPDDYLDILKERFDVYMNESIDAFNFLASSAKSSFDINADQDEIPLFAEIITKLNSQIKDSHQIYSKVSETKLQTDFGEFNLIAYQNRIDYNYHLVLKKGDLAGQRNVPLRIHSSCITGDIFSSRKCDCGKQLRESLKYISQRRFGLLIYLFQEGRGINIINKILAYQLQSEGCDTVEANENLGFPAELRNYDVIKDILSDLKIRSVDLMTNNPDKLNKLQSMGIIIEDRIPITIRPNQFSEKYLDSKKNKMGHILTMTKDNNKQNNNDMELEIKFLISSDKVSSIKEEILKIPNISYEGKFYEKVTMYDNVSKSMDKEDARLRVKQISAEKNSQESKVEFSYKRRIKADGGIKQEEEVETDFETDITSFVKIVNKMGYQPTTSYERYRETYLTRDIKVTLDQFPFGYILEVEGNEDNIKKICNLLNLDFKKSYPLSCDDVYVDLCKKKNIKIKDHILFDDLEMPQLDGLLT